MATRMHPDEHEISPDLVRRLIATQFPHWAGLPIEPVQSTGTDNALFRLGKELVIRMPRRQQSTSQVEREHRWLPRLAPHLPLPIPVPRALGTPGPGYPWHWSICPWLEGETAASAPIADPEQAARDLAAFIAALQHIDAADGPPAGPQNFNRGAPLATRDAAVRTALAALRGRIDTARATAAWEHALRAPEWHGPPVWLHGDLYPGNLLVHRGRLSAVIDFGCLGTGDPACDLTPAWSLLTGPARQTFHAALHIDDATWARGRGWAISQALIFIPYYWETNPAGVRIARNTLHHALADSEGHAP